MAHATPDKLNDYARKLYHSSEAVRLRKQMQARTFKFQRSLAAAIEAARSELHHLFNKGEAQCG